VNEDEAAVDDAGALDFLLSDAALGVLGRFRPDGSLLIVSTEDRRLLRYDGETVDTVADLSALAPADLGDMIVDSHGLAYIGSQAFHGGVILRVDPDDTVSVVARDLDFPNGMAITPDHRTLIVAESIGRPPPRLIEGAGHFLQEDCGPLLGGLIAEWLTAEFTD